MATASGSGRKKSKRPPLLVQALAVLALVGLVFGIGLAATMDRSATPPTPPPLDPIKTPVPTPGNLARYDANGHVIPTPGGSGRPSTITNPEPWQYDPASDQHWHAEHWHWHDGPPPAPERRGTPGIGTATSTDGIGARNADGSVIPTPGGSGRPSRITNPQPWQYDPESNQHWHEGHWHWHDGPPPPPEQRI